MFRFGRTVILATLLSSVLLNPRAAVPQEENGFGALKRRMERVRSDLAELYEKRKDAALQQYARNLDALGPALKQRGDVEGYILLEEEKKRFSAEHTSPETMNAPPVLAEVIAIHDRAVEEAERELKRGTTVVLKEYAAVLQRLKLQLMKADKMDDAIAVDAEQKEVMAELGGTEWARAPEPVKSGVCDACGSSGACPRCKGRGYLSFSGLNNRAVTIACTACRATGQCNACKGEGAFGADLIARPAGDEAPASSGAFPSRPSPVPTDSQQELDRYVQTMKSLDDLFDQGRFESADLNHVLTRLESSLGMLFQSRARIVSCVAREVVVEYGTSATASQSVALIPRTLKVVLKARKIFEAAGTDPLVRITFGVVSKENVTLFDIEPL